MGAAREAFPETVTPGLRGEPATEGKPAFWEASQEEKAHRRDWRETGREARRSALSTHNGGREGPGAQHLPDHHSSGRLFHAQVLAPSPGQAGHWGNGSDRRQSQGPHCRGLAHCSAEGGRGGPGMSSGGSSGQHLTGLTCCLGTGTGRMGKGPLPPAHVGTQCCTSEP